MSAPARARAPDTRRDPNTHTRTPDPDHDQEIIMSTIVTSTATDRADGTATTDLTRSHLAGSRLAENVRTESSTIDDSARGGARTVRVRTRDLIHSEWIKLRSVRSSWITLLAAGVVTVVFGMIFSAVADSGAQTPGPAAFLTDPIDIALGGLTLAEMMVGVVGVLVVAGEYSTGLIRTSFAAVGRRTRVLGAKAMVLGASVFAVSAVAVTAAIAAGQRVYAGSLPTVPVTDALDVILGATAYLTGIALIGVALGFILRSTAGGIATLVGGVFIGPNLLTLLPDSFTDVFLKYLPSEAGSAMMSQVSNTDLLGQGSAAVVFTAWVVGLLGVATYLVRRRDA